MQKEVFRKILFLCEDGNLRVLGTMKQIYSPGKADFYFSPSLRQDELNNVPIDHVTFHFSGQSHVKRIDKTKENITDKNMSICQDNLGLFILFSVLCDPKILPIATSSSIGDVTFEIHKSCSYIWCELSFVSPEYLLNNNLGFGLILSSQEFSNTLIHRRAFAAGNPVANQNMIMQISFGKVSSLVKPKKLEFRTFKTQKTKMDAL